MADATFPEPSLSVSWSGFLRDRCGYADEARQFILGLDDAGVTVRGVRVADERDLVELRPSDDHRIAALTLDAADVSAFIQQTRARAGGRHVHVSVFHIFPERFRRIPGADYHIGRTMYETDRLPAGWAARCQSMDEIWVPSAFNFDTFARAGVPPEKLVVVPEAMDTDAYGPEVRPFRVKGARSFNFLSVFDWRLRKGWDLAVRAFAAEFPAHSDAALILKVWSAAGLTAAQMIAGVRHCLGTEVPPNIVFCFDKLSAAQLPGLYLAADAYLMPSRGEGWGRPAMESLLAGRPVIATRASGQLAFLSDDNAFLVDGHEVTVEGDAAVENPRWAGHRWTEPSLDALRASMRQVYTDRALARRRAEAGRALVLGRYTRRHVGALVAERLRAVARRIHG